MSLTIVPLREIHLPDAAVLVSGRYRALRKRVPVLPSRYGEISTLLSLLESIVTEAPGVAAVDGGRLVGFLTVWHLPSFRGNPAVFSPEWANAAGAENSRHIYEEMYTHLAAAWVGDGYFTHLISILANDRPAITAWHWLGFGMVAADAVRDLQPLENDGTTANIRRARLPDLAQVMALNEALCRHLAASPTFLVDTETRGPDYYRTWLQSPDKALWLAWREAEAVAYLGLGPASDDASTIIYDEGTSSIFGAFTQEQARGEGVATALLDRALQWARAQGYRRCAVDFEPMNPLATRFWLRHFEPVCYTLGRRVDERAA